MNFCQSIFDLFSVNQNIYFGSERDKVSSFLFGLLYVLFRAKRYPLFVSEFTQIEDINPDDSPS